MGVSNITVTALTAVATVKGNALTIATNDPWATSGLPNLTLARVDIYGSTTDDFDTASVVAQGTVRALHADAGDEVSWFYWGIPYNRAESPGARYPVSATNGVPCRSLGQTGTAFTLTNGKLSVSVAANALTISVKTAAGSNPSGSDPVYVGFHNASSGVGNYRSLAITSSLSVTISSGSTLATTNGAPFRLWVVLFDDGGTPRLGVMNAYYSADNVVYPLAEHFARPSFIEGGAGGADSAGIVYADVGVSTAFYRIVGWLEWRSGLATAGAWNALPDAVNMFAVGDRKPGDVVQQAVKKSSALATHTVTIPFDSSLPQNSEGTQLFGRSFTPTSKINLLQVEAEVNCSYSVAATVIASLFKTGSTGADCATCATVGADEMTKLRLDYEGQANITSTIDFFLRTGGSVAGTMQINGTSAGQRLGAALLSWLRVKEIMI